MRNILLALALTALGATTAPAQRMSFEPPKPDVDALKEGVDIDFGADFTQTFQALDHSNAAGAPELADIGAGFNLATANVWLNARLAPGINVILETYLSSRHHPETWVKGGYLRMDAVPLDLELLDRIMQYTTLKVGHYEVNYGDAHYRRSDNAEGIDNPFVENYILDAFTTEIGGEAIVRAGPFLGVLGVTNGELSGGVANPDERSFAFITKLGLDQRFGESRARITLSTYQNDNAGRATLYGGDRAGSAYWGVLDGPEGTSFTNGRINPQFTEEIRALQVNPYLSFGPIELFGVIERAQGRAAAEVEEREVQQYAADAVLWGLEDRVYLAGRYNTVTGEILTIGEEQQVDRASLAAGWFLTPNLLLKGEYVRQDYDDFPAGSIFREGEFDGVVLQGVVSF